MKNLLLKVYNWKPFHLFSDTYVMFYPHPAQWKVGHDRDGKVLDFGPFQVGYGSSPMIWVYEDSRLVRDFTAEQQENLNKAINQMIAEWDARDQAKAKKGSSVTLVVDTKNSELH